MTWWMWVLLWLVLVVGAAVVLLRLGLGLWRKGLAGLAEVERASQVAAELSEQVSRLQAEKPREPVVTTAFDDPVALRRERTQRLAQRTRARRRQAGRGSRTLGRTTTRAARTTD
ncbi:hypothetical protein [uncultured Pseudokineococcus sp.]|uniref:hypothetical protein n=1 Tax=uncultured Pseudokineococcus sp. TaxID=1642928 RepID=UPI00261D9F36|nr:hypothetical protein [uncultured Pseudokineococcus sp.]